MTIEKLQLTNEAMEILEEEGYFLFENIDAYINYIFAETNFHDAVTMLNILKNKIDGYTLTQDEFLFIGNTESTHLDIEMFFLYLDYEGQIFE